MAVIRSLVLRRSSFSVLRAAAASPVEIQDCSSATPWRWIAVRKQTKSAKNKYREEMKEEFSFNKASVLDDYKFAYEDFKPRDLDITEIEGCDLNHWLITVEFPKRPKTSPDDMVRFYEQTVANTLSLSLEDAKKKIYACSTSNYTGFHVQVTEEESEKFRGKPGVVFILPDSYVDKERKEYGGDKYINGVIIPRQRPTLNGKATEEEREKDKQGPSPTQQGAPETRLDQQHQASYGQEESLQPNQARVPPPYSQQGPGRNLLHLTPPSYPPHPQSNVSPYTQQGPTQVSYPPPTQNYSPQYTQYQSHEAPPSYPPPPQNYRPTYIQQWSDPHHGAPPSYSPPYMDQWTTQGPGQNHGGPPSFPPPPLQYGPPSPASFGRISYQQGAVYSIPYQGNYNHGWAVNYPPPSPLMGFGWPSQPYGPNPSNVFYNWQSYGAPGQGPHQANWHGQVPPYSGGVGQGYHAPPVEAQDYTPPGDYRDYGPQQGSTYGHQQQQQHQEDGDYQGQGPPMRYWRRGP